MNTQELRNKVESLEAELKVFKEQLDEQLKTNEFEIDYRGNYLYLERDGSIDSGSAIGMTTPAMKFGTVRKTRELAEIARDNMRARNKLEELVHWLEPDWKPDWDDYEQKKSCIYYIYDNNKFEYHYFFENRVIGAVYMSEKTAKKICNALNDGLLPDLADILKG